MRRVYILLLLTLLLFSCTKEKGDSSTINIALSQEPVTLDVMVSSSLSSRLIASGNIYEKLLVLDDEGNIRCELAESWELTNENKTLTFVIRKGVLFHDGSIMKAEDVKESMNRYLSLYSRAEEITRGAQFEEIDDYTISITSVNSLLFLPYLIASSPQEAIVMPSYLIDGTKEVSSIIGTGPYKLSYWRSGEKIELVAFSDYSEYGDEASGRWGKKRAQNDALVYYFVPDSVMRVLSLQSGQVDFINDVMSSDWELLARRDDITLINGDESGSIALVYNKASGIMTNKDVRDAVSYALSSDLLMAACYGKTGYNTSSLYMEKSQEEWKVDGESRYKEENKEKAQEILSSLSDVKVRILTSNLSNLDKIAIAAKEALESVKIKCEIIALDWAGFVEKRKDKDAWDIYISAFTSVPLPMMKSYLASSFPGWIEKSVNEDLNTLFNSASSIEEARAIWKEEQELLWEYNGVYIPGHYYTVYAASSSLDNIIVQNGFYFWATSKK